MTTTPEQPFRQEVLNRIFTISPKHQDRLISRESSWLEFKESFGFGSLGKYIRSAAAFANAKGGYIAYGIKNKPHILLGLNNNAFDELDPEKLSHFLNEHFDPEIRWERHLYELDGKVFGLLYFYESTNKPVVCKKGTDDGKSLKEGEIYYRYSGRTQTIRYPELKELIEERRKQEQLLWFKHIKEMARIGVKDVGLFDLRSGKVTGAGGSFLIDESLLSQVSFIREGEFNEVKGKPALKIIGTAEPIGKMPLGLEKRMQIVKTKGIRSADIMLAFLKSEIPPEPQSYVTQICYENSAFLPIYFLIANMEITLEETVTLIDREPSTQTAKSKLKARLLKETSLTVPKPSTSNQSGQRKLKARQLLLEKKVSANAEGEILNDILDMMRTLTPEEIDALYLKSILLEIFNRNFGRKEQTLNDRIRRAICYLDWKIHFPNIKTANKVSEINSTIEQSHAISSAKIGTTTTQPGLGQTPAL